jgi:glycerol-3-phosphate cytidylyltransferase
MFIRRVITYGTFDLLHLGHIRLLKRAKELGEYLIVAVSTDDFNNIKGKTAYQPYVVRKEMVEAIKYVDLVIAEETWIQKINDIKNYMVDVFVIGDDWLGRFDFLKDYCDVIYLPRTKGISSTKIKLDLATKLE